MRHMVAATIDNGSTRPEGRRRSLPRTKPATDSLSAWIALLSVVVILAVLTGCSSGHDEGEPVTIGVTDSSDIEPVAFDEVARGACIGGTGPVDGKVPSVSCDVPGAIPVQDVVVLGHDAPAERPVPAVVNGYAVAACQDSVQEYADERNRPVTGLLQIAVISDTEWSGPETPVVCAVSEVG